jgi:hypothetical protein
MLCENCGTDHSGTYASGRFCSKKCSFGFSTKAKRELINEKVSKALKREYEFFEKICEVCSVNFQTVKNTQRFCSSVCQVKHLTNSPEAREKISISVQGKTGGYRTKSGTAKRYGAEYRGVWLDSSWEVKFAERLNSLGVHWERPAPLEYCDESGKRRKYYADFFLPGRNLYVEIKGYHTPKSRQKMKAVMQEHMINLVELHSPSEIENFE